MMIHFTPTVTADSERIRRWIDKDPDHAGKSSPEWWTKGTVLSCCAEDQAGPVMYLRIDKEEDKARMHIQFAPQNEVSKLRVAGAFIDGIPRMLSSMKHLGFSGLIFKSTSASLIRFMGRMGFVSIGDDDFVRT